jgi:hypothetical protein
MISGTSSGDQWQRLGALLIQRRTQLSPRFHNRGAFCEATGLKYRLIYDIEEARRTNFGSSTLAAIEAAYRLAPGAIGRYLAGGGVREILPDAAPPAPAPAPPGEQLPAVLQVRDEAALEPYVRAVTRDLWLAIGIDPGANVPPMPDEVLQQIDSTLTAAQIFPDEGEHGSWEIRSWSPRLRLRLIAVLRKMTAEAAGEPGRRKAVLIRSNSAAGTSRLGHVSQVSAGGPAVIASRKQTPGLRDREPATRR